jgi:hypothetical protein
MAKTAVKEPKKVQKAAAQKIAEPVATPEAVVEEIALEPVCQHRWVIETPNGETSQGVCRVCGSKKDFPNAAEDGLWERNVPQSRWTGRTDWTPTNTGF